MDTALSILFVEDSESDVLLIIRVLRREGYAPNFERVDTPEDLRAALDGQAWDLVITDHNMPYLDSVAVISILKEPNHHEDNKDIPVIIVSGIIPEDTAVAAMKLGANDYIMKDNLTRLIPAIQRELDEARMRRAHKRAESAIYYMRNHDALTNLVNRKEFERRLQRVIESSWERGVTHAVLYLDLDQFKIINDTCGHVAGDALLKQLAVELKERIRDSDTLARLGGDEFGVLLENCGPDDAIMVANNLLNCVKSFEFNWNGVCHKITASIGFIEVSSTNSGIDEILSAIDVACYTAKEMGRNRIQIYEKENIDLSRRHSDMYWVTRLNTALAEDKFVLYKQDVVPLNGRGNGMERWEFLLRMIGKEGEVLYPDEFIPAAERFNIMPEIDRWVIRKSFQYLYDLFSHRRMHVDPGMFFINVSGSSLSDSSFYAYIKEQLRKYQLPPQMICFEITETVAITQLDKAIEFIENIRQGGCRIALDDFGSGLNTFSFLKEIPVDFLKIDGSFVKNIGEGKVDYAIVEAIQHVAERAGIHTIAEIVEEDSIIHLLKEIGVDYMQGYSIEIPRPVEQEFVKVHSA